MSTSPALQVRAARIRDPRPPNRLTCMPTPYSARARPPEGRTGLTEFTRMLLGARSRAAILVKWRTAALPWVCGHRGGCICISSSPGHEGWSKPPGRRGPPDVYWGLWRSVKRWLCFLCLQEYIVISVLLQRSTVH